MDPVYIARHPAAAWRRLEDEVIVISASDSSLFTLNEVAAEIWECADGRTPLAEIVAHHIVTRYDVGFDEAYRDARELVEQLAGKGILIVSGEPITGGDGR
jgi:hypothetical protein